MAYDPRRDICGNCLHYEGDPGDPDNGTCHRFPPSYIARYHLWDFAAVVPDNTCGEHVSIISDEHAQNKNNH